MLTRRQHLEQRRDEYCRKAEADRWWINLARFLGMNKAAELWEKDESFHLEELEHYKNEIEKLPLQQPLMLVPKGDGVYRVELKKEGEYPKGSFITENLEIHLGKDGKFIFRL